MGLLILILLLFLSCADLPTASSNSPPKRFATTPPQVFNFLLRPHRFPLSTYLHPWSIQHHDDLANLTLLRDELFYYDRRVRRDGGETQREFDKRMKRVVRVPRWKGMINGETKKEYYDAGEIREEKLLGGGKVGRAGGWVGDAILGGGDGQRVEFVLDMLSADLVIYSTTAGGGFERGVSDSYLSKNTHVTNNCVISSDHLTLPHWPSSISFPFLPAVPGTQVTTIRVPFTHCLAHRATLSTLLPSGAVWGLAFPSLSHNSQSSLVKHLHNSSPLFYDSGSIVLKRSIWSFATISSTEAILTLGGTVVEFAPEKEWRWTELKDQVEGYWEVNMQSVLVEGVRVLRTIPRVVIDVSSPLIIGPEEMVEAVWNFVEGARRLWELELDSNGPDTAQRQILEELAGEWWDERAGEIGEWWVYPCLNEPLIQLEFAGWGFPVDRVGLGKVREGSGYCVGSIVGWPRHIKHSETTNPGSEDEKRVWILGGPFWSGVVGVFDIEKKRVGMRTL